MKKILLSAITLALLGSGVQAGGDIAPVVVPVPLESGCHNGFYVGAGLSDQRTYSKDSDWFDDSILGQDKTIPLIGVLGYQFNCYLALEGRVGKSLFEEDYADVLTYSIFLKPQYPVTEDFSVYGLIGYGVVRVKGTDGHVPAANVGKTIVDTGSFQWGFGMQYDITDEWSIFLDYTSLMKDKSISPQPLYNYDASAGRTWDKISDDSINVGVLYHF